jgi:hypothetical protein
MKLNLHGYFVMEEPALPDRMPSPTTYVFAANGVYVWARRDGLEVLVPYQPCRLRGLEPVTPFVRLCDGLPRVPAAMIREMLWHNEMTRCMRGEPAETLFFLYRDGANWRLTVPPQQQSRCAVHAISDQLDLDEYAQVLMEVHTHPGSANIFQPGMRAFFSSDDDKEEHGLRFYGVFGGIQMTSGGVMTAEMRMRVSIYGEVFYEFPASEVVDLPPEIRECLPMNTVARQRKEQWEVRP